MVVRVVYIGAIVNHQCLNFIFTIFLQQKLISRKNRIMILPATFLIKLLTELNTRRTKIISI